MCAPTHSNLRPIITSQYKRGKVMVIRFKLIYVLTERHFTVHRGTAFVAVLNFQSSQRQLSPKYCITFPDFIFETFSTTFIIFQKIPRKYCRHHVCRNLHKHNACCAILGHPLRRKIFHPPSTSPWPYKTNSISQTIKQIIEGRHNTRRLV